MINTIELGENSPLRVHCLDKKIEFSDFYSDEKYIDLIERFMKCKKLFDYYSFSYPEMELLIDIDKRLDIPKVEIFHVVRSNTLYGGYKSLKNMYLRKYKNIPKWLLSRASKYIILCVEHDEFNFLKWISYKLPLPVWNYYYDISCHAIIKNNLELLKWLRNSYQGNVCPWGDNAMYYAAEVGNLEMLEYIRDKSIHGDNICPWDYLTTSVASLTTLKWLRDFTIHGEDVCPWNPSTCSEAIIRNDFETLKWLRNEEIHGDDVCPWSHVTSLYAISLGHYDMFCWMTNNTIHGNKACPYYMDALILYYLYKFCFLKRICHPSH